MTPLTIGEIHPGGSSGVTENYFGMIIGKTLYNRDKGF